MTDPPVPDVPEPTPEELVMLDRFTHACCVIVAVRYRNIRDDVVGEHASGVLVRFGGRDFVFTAGHIVQSRKEEEVTIHFPRKVYVVRKPGESIGKVTSSKHPDVGVIELDRRDAGAWQHMSPCASDAVLDWREVGPQEPIGVFGLPVAHQTASTEPRIPGTNSLSVGGVCAVTVVQKDVENEHAPEGGHGFYVYFSRLQPTHSDKVLRIEPDGMSGGPVFTIERGAYPMLVGLIRSKLHGRYLWCEPIRYAIELLLDHEDEAVVRDARDALATLTSGD
jgi:hypothetical protein